MAQQTAVEWFDEQIQEYVIASDHITRNLIVEISFEDYMELKNQAKQMEKEQRFKDFRAGQDSMEEGGRDFEQYYNETYKYQ